MENVKLEFDLDSLEGYLKSNSGYKNIALQFDEDLSSLSIGISDELRAFLPDRFIFIVGESCYGQCCADDIAALHLNANIIVRIGNSCLTRNKQLPVYFLFEMRSLEEEKVKETLCSIKTQEEGNVVVIYNHKYTYSFNSISHNLKDNKYKISIVAYKPEIFEDFKDEEDFLLSGRILKNTREVNKQDVIIYFGGENDKILIDLCLKYINHNSIYLVSEDYSVIQMTTQSVNKIFYKRFNLIEKAKESEVFGIIVGSLSIKGLNQVIEEVKATLKLHSKKFYTFLLGKITLEKLSNFVEYIDCFVLISCPFSDFYDFKTLMKPLVSPLDISMAFNAEKFKWDLSYTFDPNFILSKGETKEKKKNSEIQTDGEITVKITGLKLKEEEKNQALANIFSFKTLQNYDSKKYKGLSINETKAIVEKFKLGKTGIPIKYEDII